MLALALALALALFHEAGPVVVPYAVLVPRLADELIVQQLPLPQEDIRGYPLEISASASSLAFGIVPPQ
ncbi:hypothetical protein EAI_16755 [Harpegnathos saltator]|uniref:Uncharacterized protein n=1 Tax=Harpegnathos saltator TaxID=610380 RepID=E2B7Y0_HARSA|nr:hypothetical protein EAI_16755 [Harpegnathos saltator]